MEKLFNARESYMIQESLDSERENAVAKIREMEADGKHPMFTVGFIEQEIGQLIDKIKENTKKEKNAKD
jgi:hypothetical protein